MLAARVLLVLAAFQVGGGPHVIAAVVGDTTCIDSCSDGDGQCPPGCPDCVCVHGHLPSTVPVPPSLPNVVVLDELLIDLPYEAATPPSPPHDALERPPKA